MLHVMCHDANADQKSSPAPLRDNAICCNMSSEQSSYTQPSSRSSSQARSSPLLDKQQQQQSSLATIVKAQVSFLLSTIHEGNFEKNASEIRTLTETHGSEISNHLLRRLLIVNQLTHQPPRKTEDTQNTAAHLRLLQREFHRIASDPLQAHRVLTAVEADQFRDLDLKRLFELVPLSPVEQVTVCSTLLQSSKPEIREKGFSVLSDNLSSFCEALRTQETSQLTPEQLSVLIRAYLTDPARQPTFSLSQQQTVVDAVSVRFPSHKPEPIQQALHPFDTMSEERAKPLSQHLLSLGYIATSSLDNFRAVLARKGTNPSNPLNVNEVADALMTMLRTMPNDGDQSWRGDIFGNVIGDLCPHLDWNDVVRSLDKPEFMVFDVRGFDVLVGALRESTVEVEKFPIHPFFNKWTHHRGQLSFIRSLLTAPTDSFHLMAYPGRRIINNSDFTQSSANVKALAAVLASQTWNSLDLLEVLVDLEESDSADEAQIVLEKGAKQTPELILLGLISLPTPWSPMHTELITKLLNLFFAGHSSHQLVFTRLWAVNSHFTSNAFRDFYAENPTNVTRILDIAQDLKILAPLLEIRPFVFAIDLASLASRREYLNLEKWLQDNIFKHGDVFVRACIDFLSIKIMAESSDIGQQTQTIPLSIPVVAIFLRVLLNVNTSQENIDLLKEVHGACLQAYPRLMNLRPNSDGSVGEIDVTHFSAEIEAEVDSYYKRMYDNELKTDDIILLLQKFRNSEDPREQDIYACMVHSLFDEYRFFPKYPPAELQVTGILFGSLIQYQVIGKVPLGIALRYVLDALRHPPDSSLFNFGMSALLQFRSRLSEWRQYANNLLAIPALQEQYTELYNQIQASIGVGSSTNRPSETPVEEAADSEPKEVFQALRLDPAMEAEAEQCEEPDEATQDRILFIVNNVAQSNLDAKVAEMKDRLQPEHFKWFANYLVVRRAAQEPNYHQLYLNFLDALDKPKLTKFVVHETFANIKVLLNSEETVNSTKERTLLKNLGSWLGGLTLAKNKPIKHKNLAFKELLLEGYDGNRLIVAIPFVCKVLDQASKSKVFKPPNPWLVAILKLLLELYRDANLKQNLIFEIEVLCKSLDVNVKDFTPTNILTNRPSTEQVLAAQAPTGVESELEHLSLSSLASGALPSQAGGVASGTTSASTALPNLAQFTVLNPSLGAIATNPSFKRVIHVAIDRAIREIIAPVVERSVTIAGISTRELVLKDFAMEGNEERMSQAAHYMVQNLAGSLALVTCKEPLKISMATHVRSLLTQNGFNEHNVSDATVQQIVSDNLDLACSIIEKAAMDKAVPEIDEGLAPAFAARKKHRDRTNQPYFDQVVYQATRYMSSLPEPLKLKPGGLQPQQFKVYDDFAGLTRMQQQGAAKALPTPSTPQFDAHRAVLASALKPEASAAPLGERGAFDTPAATPMASARQSMLGAQPGADRFPQYIAELEKLVGQNAHLSVETLPPNHDIRLIVRQIPAMAGQAFNRDETALQFSLKIVQLLYKVDSPFGREIYVILLERLCQISAKCAKEVMTWLIYADDERKYNVPVTVVLIKVGLINVVSLDIQLAKLIDNDRASVIDFAAKLIQECVLKDPACAARAEFVNSLEALARVMQRSQAPESVVQLLEELRARAPGQQRQVDFSKPAPTSSSVREQLTYVFAEWVRLYQHPSSNEKTFVSFIVQLQQQGVLKGEEVSTMFFRVCTELSVEAYNKQKEAGGTPATGIYQPVDAFSKLIVLLVKYYADPNESSNDVAKVNYLTKILSIIVLVVAAAHEQERSFQQKPFFRLFSSLLSDLNANEQHFQSIYFEILTALSNTLHTLQPFFLPGFTFSWLSLISHRLFMPKLLLAKNKEGWATFHKLLISLFKFLVPFLRNVEMRDTTRLLYKGTLRVLLVLLHDFPEFLCEYHFSFCDVIPSSCIQLRNLILSAFPRNMRLPDPFTPNLKVDLLPEINQAPKVLSDYTSSLEAVALKADLDKFLANRGPSSFLGTIAEKLKNKEMPDGQGPLPDVNGSSYNVPVINALVVYSGIHAVDQLQEKAQGGSMPFTTSSASMDIFQHLLNELDSEGRYLFLSAIANQLRYPNCHTHYFSCVLLYLFGEGSKDAIKEQVTRVLLERLIVNRPHPWGLLITFIELIKNPRYNFWSHSFVRCAADIERLFDSVSRSINQV